MAYLLVRHKVTNFEARETAYDDHRDARQLAGLHLPRNRAEPNDIVFLFQTDNPERTRAFIWSDELRKIMHGAGAVGTPEMVELE